MASERPASQDPVASPPALRFGQHLPDGSVRFVVRPIPWGWVLGTGAVALAFIVYLLAFAGAPWFSPVAFLALPFGVTWHEGFDVRTREGEIYGWKALGPFRYGTFTLRHLKLPEVRSAMETHTSSDGTESTNRVTRLWWGSRNLRVGIARGELDALLDEAKAAGLTPMKGRAKR